MTHEPKHDSKHRMTPVPQAAQHLTPTTQSDDESDWTKPTSDETPQGRSSNKSHPTHDCNYLVAKEKDKRKFGTESDLRNAINGKDNTTMGTWLKILGIVYGVATPFVVWIVVTIYGHSTELAILKMKQDALTDQLQTMSKLFTKMDELNTSISKIQIDIAIIKTKGNIP